MKTVDLAWPVFDYDNDNKIMRWFLGGFYGEINKDPYIENTLIDILDP